MLKEGFDSIISKSQSGFINGRIIGKNTILIYDVMYYIESEDLSGQLLLIDFEKASNSLSWPFSLQFSNLFWTWAKFYEMDQYV